MKVEKEKLEIGMQTRKKGGRINTGKNYYTLWVKIGGGKSRTIFKNTGLPRR